MLSPETATIHGLSGALLLLSAMTIIVGPMAGVGAFVKESELPKDRGRWQRNGPVVDAELLRNRVRRIPRRGSPREPLIRSRGIHDSDDQPTRK
jgi:hypothetical protein